MRPLACLWRAGLRKDNYRTAEGQSALPIPVARAERAFLELLQSCRSANSATVQVRPDGTGTSVDRGEDLPRLLSRDFEVAWKTY